MQTGYCLVACYCLIGRHSSIDQICSVMPNDTIGLRWSYSLSPFWNAQMLFLEEYQSMDYTIQVKCRIDKVSNDTELASAGIVFRSFGPGENSLPLYGFGIGDSGAKFGFLHG